MDLVSFVKKTRFVYWTYYYFMSLALNFIRLFVRTDEHLILFVSYGGRYFNESPKCIYEAMLKDPRFRGYKLVWAFRNPDSINIITPKVRIDTLQYYLTALKARCWVTNVVVERGLNFKGKNTFYLHTTHTTFLKLMGYDDKSNSFDLPCGYKYDCSCAQSEEDMKAQMSMFHIKKEQIMMSGYPKNDCLCHYEKEERDSIRSKFGIDDNKVVILYAPTYRDISFGEMKCPIDFKKWESVLGPKYVVLFRAHPVVANATQIDSSTGFIYDVSGYPDNMELMIASDILISDYSGIFFEYGVQNKPMFCFAYDYDEYTKVRGLYFDIREVLPGGYLTEEELLEEIKQTDPLVLPQKVSDFKEKYIRVFGNATKICVDKIYDVIAHY